MRLVGLAAVLTLSLTLAPLAAEAQQARVYRLGIILQGGPHCAAIDRLRDGFRELGLEEERPLHIEGADEIIQ